MYGKDRDMDTFERELKILINRHSMENESNTPDFILAQYLRGCLEVFNAVVQQREKWYGRDPRPCTEVVTELEAKLFDNRKRAATASTGRPITPK